MKQVRTKTIKAKELIEDIRAGLSDAELITKYDITEKGLKKAFNKLLENNALTPQDLYARTGLIDEVTANLREASRSYFVFSIPVYDTEDITVEGWIADIAEKGLQTVGIPAVVGNVRNLLIRADEFHDIYPFAFEAVCRWVVEEEEGNTRAGYEITDISDIGARELRKLIRLLAI